MRSHGFSRNKLPAPLQKKRARDRIAEARTLRLELLEDRIAPSVSPLASIAVRQLPASHLEPLPASLLGPQGQDVSGPLASLLERVLGSSGSAPDAAAAGPASPSFNTPLVNNPNEDVNIPNRQDTQSETSVLVIPGTTGPPRIVTAFNDTGSLNPFGQYTLQGSTENKLTGYSVFNRRRHKLHR